MASRALVAQGPLDTGPTPPLWGPRPQHHGRWGGEKPGRTSAQSFPLSALLDLTLKCEAELSSLTSFNTKKTEREGEQGLLARVPVLSAKA